MLTEDMPYDVIRRRLMLTFAVLILTPVLVVFLSTTYSFKKYALVKVETIETTTCNHIKDVISLFLKKQENLLATLSGMYSIEQLGDQEFLNKLFVTVNRMHEIVDIHVINASGKQIAYVGPYREKIRNKSYHDQPWFKEVLINGRHTSDIFSGYRDVPHFVVSVTDPLKTFVLRATINSDIFNALLLRARIGINGDAFIINSRSEFQTPSLQGVYNLTPEEKRLLEHHEGTTIQPIGSYIYATSWIRDGRWLLVIKSLPEDFLGLYYQKRNFNIVVLVITSAIVMVVAAFVDYFMVRRLERITAKTMEINHQMVQVEKMATVGRLAAGIAHEVNNPLQMITNQAGWIDELLFEEDPDQMKNLNDCKEAVGKIQYHVKRAGTITHRLLGFSRKMEAEKECLSMNGLIEETISFVENDARNNNIRIETDFTENLPSTMSDGPQLQQVFLNLLNNSMDAIGTDGWIKVRTRADADTIYMQFSDSGTGIKEEILNRIFDPFFTTKDPGKGTGLGMSISYSIIRKLGGTIEVQNTKGGGACFTLTLPIVKLGE